MAVYTPATMPGLYFTTFTCYRWLSLIELTQSYDAVYKWFDYLPTKGHTVCGFVVMPNHLHVLLHYGGGAKSLNGVIGNAKRFLAYDIVKRLQQQGEDALLKQLGEAVEFKDRQRGKLHEIWEDTFEWKECRRERFVLQKLRYLHNNPCSGHWKLVRDPVDYPHSSARFYHTGQHAAYAVKDYREFLVNDDEEE